MASQANSALTPEELISKGLAPVKREFIRQTGPRVHLEAVAGAGSTAQAQQVKKKSRNQAKKERGEKQAQGLCTRFAQGECTFGDSCRFSHDIPKFLEQKPPDRPGKCPFSALDRCPFGITCRWASRHANLDELTRRHLLNGRKPTDSREAGEEQPGLPEPSEEAVQDGAAPEEAVQDVAAPEEAVQDVAAPEEAAQDVAAPEEAVQDVAAPEEAAQDVAAPEEAAQDVAAPEEAGPAEAEAGEAAAPGAAAPETAPLERGRQHGASHPSEVELPAQELPVSSSICDSVNRLDQQLQATLRRGIYDFTKADTLLRSMGVRIKRPGRKPKDKQAAAPAKEEAAPAAKRVRREAGEGAAEAEAEAGGEDGGEAGEARGEEAGPEDEADGAFKEARLRPEERREVDFRGKLVLAPLTTVGNLPFRRLCKQQGADITVGEMALATNLLQGQASEWALLKRHPSEDVFGVQICGGYADSIARVCQLLDERVDVSFVDINCGCPIDLICSKGAGSSLLQKPGRLEQLVRSASRMLTCPLTIKVRKGYYDGQDVVHSFLPQVADWGAAAVTVHGRTRQQRYSRLSDWEYIEMCACTAPQLQVIGNGDVFSWTDWRQHIHSESKLASCMIARGALIKPWIFTEIKEERHWDISAGERLDLLKDFCRFGLEHWGSDNRGLETTRRFLLEWLSFLHRYIPVGLLEVVPQQMHWRPPALYGRNDLETLLGSDNAADWVRISEMLLGPAPAGFSFAPKHKSNAYSTTSEVGMAFDLEVQNG